MRRNADLRNAGWGPLRWPPERRWIREAEALVDRELARWIEPPAPADAEPEPEPERDGSAEDDEAEPVGAS
jgi:hypothetical protein